MNNQQHQRRRRSIESLNLSSNLPDDLILQILLRLPVRSLMRFKSVCKSWRSLISDPEFGKSHFDLAATAPTHRCLAKVNVYGIESIDIDASLHDNSSVVNHKFPLPSSIDDDADKDDYLVEFLGSCRGFILVAYPYGDVFVWNPSTGVKRRIATDVEDMNYLYLNGFGYDASTDDYLLVLIELVSSEDYQYSHPNVVANIPIEVCIFSVKSNSWYYPQGSYPQYVEMEDHEFRVGSLTNEALHWLVISYETDLQVIIAFDLAQRSLSEIPLSQVLARKLSRKQYYLRVMGECLSLCYLGGATSTAEIWAMKEYKVRSSWTKLFAFSTCNIPRNVFHPISFTKYGRIFGSNGSGILMILNDKGWLHDLSTTCQDPNKYSCMPGGTYRENFLHCGTYRETLLPLPNDFEERKQEKMTSRPMP